MENKNKFNCFLILIILLSIFFRFYQIEKRTPFASDQETTVAAIKNMFINRRISLLGPRVKGGDIYLEPFYYYLSSLPLFLAQMDPSGIAIFASIVGVLTTIGFYLVTNQLFKDKKLALFTAFIHACSSYLIHFDRIAWNPNLTILTILFLILAIDKIYRNKLNYWLLAALTFGLSFSLHFSAAFLLLILLALFLRKPSSWPSFKIIFLAITILAFLLAPLIIFDFRHQFINTKSLNFFLIENQAISWTTIFSLPGKLFSKSIIILDSFANIYFYQAFFVDRLKDFKSIILVLTKLMTGMFLVLGFMKIKNINNIFNWYSFFSFMAVVLGYSFFKGETPDYYFFILYPIGVILISSGLVKILEWNKIIFLLLISVFIGVNLFSFFTSRADAESLWVKKEIVEFIISRQKKQPFNISYTTQWGFNTGFDYLFNLSGRIPSGNLNDPTYTIIVPFDFENIKPDYVYYGIGVNFPR